MQNLQEKKVDKTLESTMDASDAPAFEDPSKRKDLVELLYENLAPLTKVELPASVQAKFDEARACVSAYRDGVISKTDAVNLMASIVRDSEIQIMMERGSRRMTH